MKVLAFGAKPTTLGPMTHPKLTVAAREIRRNIALAQAELASGRFGGHQTEQLG